MSPVRMPKGADDEIYMTQGKYTTCDNKEHPHFYLKLSMAKVRPKKDVVFGPAQLVVEDVPLPDSCSFRFLPIQQQLFLLVSLCLPMVMK